MIKNKHLPHNITNTRIDITFCGKGKCKCPAISIDENDDKITIGGDDEGYTKVTKEVFKQFVSDAKDESASIFSGSHTIKMNRSGWKTGDTRVILGDDDSGYTEFTKEEFKLFMDEVKSGTFDSLIG
jgi:hypothetical protein